MPRNTISPEERLWLYTEKTDDCWIWRGYHFYPDKDKKRGPYGMIFAYGQSVLVHRFAWRTIKGPIPEGKDVRQVCENTLCIRPDHLEVGNFRGNAPAMTISDSRRYWNAYHSQKVSQAMLAREAGVSLSLMNRLLRGECP